MLKITLTDSIRSLPYFSSFTEDEVEVPAKPFLQELLAETLDLEALSAEDLCQCIETCIYFALDTTEILREIIWKIGAERTIFNAWFTAVHRKTWEVRWRSPVLVRAELAKVFGTSFKREALIALGIRCLDPSGFEIAKAGNLRLLIWSAEQASDPKESWTVIISRELAKHGHLACLKYVHEQGCPWDAFTCLEAARGGHLDCLKYLHEQGCPWHSNVYEAAANAGHFECFKYAHENGRISNMEMWNAGWSRAALVAVQKGQLEIVRYIHERGWPLKTGRISTAASCGHLDCLKYLREQGHPWEKDTCESAAMAGQLECLQYAHEHGAPWDEKTCLYASLEGSLECIKYAREHGCSWDADECYSIAQTFGNKACMEYIAANRAS